MFGLLIVKIHYYENNFVAALSLILLARRLQFNYLQRFISALGDCKSSLVSDCKHLT